MAVELDPEIYMLSDDGQYYEMRPDYLEKYRASIDEQLGRWVAGDSQHNHVHNECCPDFSCCCPELAWSTELRIQFMESGPDDRLVMLLSSIQRAVNHSHGVSEETWANHKLSNYH